MLCERQAHGRNRIEPKLVSRNVVGCQTCVRRVRRPKASALDERKCFRLKKRFENYAKMDGKMFPEQYQKAIFIAQHGSWNRSKKVGYRIMLAKLEGNKVISYEPFATGWLEGEKAWGRPVDVQQLVDGSLLVSDDYANAIYRIYYEGE